MIIEKFDSLSYYDNNKNIEELEKIPDFYVNIKLHKIILVKIKII